MVIVVPHRRKPLADDVAGMAFVQSSALCQGVGDENLAHLYDCGEVLDYAPGALVFSQGDIDDSLYMVLDGGVNVIKRHAKGHVVLASLDRQAIFGEIAVLTEQPRSSAVMTRVETRVIRFAGEAVRSIAHKAPKFGRRLAALMAGRRKDTQRKLG
jgi:CRP-like cAMP-binding protein